MRLKSFKKYIIGLILIWLIIVIAGLVFSRSMQGKIVDILSEQASKHLNTQIHIRKNDIRFSVFKKFPLASVELRNVCFKIPPSVNLNESLLVKGDTLLYAKNLFLQLNLRSLFDDKYELKKISLKDSYLQIVSDKQGNSSLDIIKKTKSGESSPFTASIEAFLVNNLTVYSSDKVKKALTTTFVKDGSASGLFTQENFLITLKANGRLTNINANNQFLEPNQPFTIDTEIDFKNNRYSINRGSFKLSNIPFTVLGTIAPSENNLIDLIFSAKSVPLKQVDKAVLRGLIGESGFVPKGGTLSIQTTLLGYTRHSLPAIKAKFTIKNGEVYDTQRKITYENIYINGNADNGQKHLPKTTTIRIDSFRIQIGESSQTGKLKIQNLLNPVLSATSRGYMNVKEVQNLIKIPDIQMVEGSLKNNLAISGFIIKDAIKDNNLIDKLTLWGDLSINNVGLVFEKYKIPYTQISGDVKLLKDLSLRFDSLKTNSGHSDITINGQLKNVLRRDGKPQFIGSVYSSYFLADDFILPSTSATKRKKLISFPDSILVSGSIEIETFKFGNFTTNNVKSDIKYRNKQLILEPFTMDGFSGSLAGNLRINQLENSNIEMISSSRLTNVDINKLFLGCNEFSQDVINSKNISGTISGNVEFTTQWTNRLDFLSKSLSSNNSITIQNGELIDYQPMLGLSDFINVEELKHIKFDKLKASVSIRNRKVILDQTTIASSAITFDGSGIHDFDNKYEYRLQLGLADVLWGKAKRKKKDISEFGYIVDDGVGHTVLPLLISGKGTTFNVKYDKRKARDTFKNKIKEEKKELKTLFSTKDKEKEVEEEAFKLEEEKDTVETIKLDKTDTGTYKIKNDEHTIIWDDGEDEN